MCRTRAGDFLRGRAAPSMAERITPWSMSLTKMLKRTQSGLGKRCRRRLNGNSQARGGLEGATFVWGNEFAPGGRMMANTWQGEFPFENLKTDGFEGTSPCGVFPANGYGLYDMAGNVWEWTCDLFRPRHGGEVAKACCIPRNPRVTSAPQNESGSDARAIRRNVLKGGSHLCAPNYCFRYRPAARQGETIETSACHIGFRCIVRTGKAENPN